MGSSRAAEGPSGPWASEVRGRGSRYRGPCRLPSPGTSSSLLALAVAAGALLGKPGNGRSILDPVLDRTTAVVAAEQFGLALQAFETTLDYLKTRVQFGQVIGTFQALQHRAAKLFTEIQLTRPCIEQALFALDEGLPEAPMLVSLAKTTANDLAHTISREMIQLHGGIGMTDAHDAGFYIKRARALEAAFGSSALVERGVANNFLARCSCPATNGRFMLHLPQHIIRLRPRNLHLIPVRMVITVPFLFL